MEEIDTACTMIANEEHEDATVIWGVAFDPEMEDAMKVTIIATGFENKNEKVAATAPAAEAVKAQTPVAAPAAPVAPVADPDDITDDELDELLGMLQNKDKKPEAPASIPGYAAPKRFF
jgi:cell division protein FtsZ